MAKASGSFFKRETVKGIAVYSLPVFFLILLNPCFELPAYSATEFGVKDDVTVMGVDGTVSDPNLEVKGFSIFGSTDLITHISTAPGNTVFNGAVEISSDVFVVGKSSFSAPVSVLDAGGASTYLFVRDDGNVGIGTINPNTKLHIASSTLTLDGTGAPATGGALCLNASGRLSKCASAIDGSGNCTCP